MGLAYFDTVDESTRQGCYLAQPSTAGPWATDLQHGGPPNALLVDAAERAAAAETGRTDLFAARIAADFVGPVPVAEVRTTARIVRAARSATLVEAELTAAGRSCLQARIWLIAHRDTTGVAAGVATGTAPIEPVDGRRGIGASFPYGDSIDWRTVAGGLDQIGPGTAWARPRQSIVAGRNLSDLQRAVLIGDSASGISAALDWAQWSFLNVDLDVHLARPVHGDWLLMQAATQLGTHGFALARSSLSDLSGPVGATAQTLVLGPRPR